MSPPNPTREKQILITSPGEALWNQREAIAASRERLKALSQAVGRPTSLTIDQWAQIAAFALDFRPDLIIELGRDVGNSTCCFLEVANRLGGSRACKLVSLCLSDAWLKETVPRLKRLVPEEWFAPGDIRTVNILDFDFRTVLEQCQRPLIFWDAHGFEIAECVLGGVLPNLVNKRHRVLMHDLSDIRYSHPPREYGDLGLWKGENASYPSFWLGHIWSRVAQAISILDFTNRNNLPLHSADESLHQVFADDAGKLAELRSLLGGDMVSLQGHWFWFSLDEGSGKFTFPRFTRAAGAHATEESPGRAISDLRQQLDSLRQQIQDRSPQDGRPESEVEPLQDGMRAVLEGLKTCEQKLIELERRWREMEQSARWHLLTRWRTLGERLAPTGSLRRKLYDALLRRLR